MRISIKYGSHLPILMKIFGKTTGPILELGMGVYSTPYLHWACFPNKRKLVSYENDLRWIRYFRDCRSDYHEVRLVDDWNNLATAGLWDIVLIDYEPDDQRSIAAKKFANNARYIILHDSEPEHDSVYQYSKIYPLFKYRFDYMTPKASTTVLSNFIDLRHLDDASDPVVAFSSRLQKQQT